MSTANNTTPGNPSRLDAARGGFASGDSPQVTGYTEIASMAGQNEFAFRKPSCEITEESPAMPLSSYLTRRSTNLPASETYTSAPDTYSPCETNSTGPLPRLAVGVMVALCAAKLLLHIFISVRHYGYFRDELYYLDMARHLDWGYVDAAPLIAVYAKVAMLMGGSLAALRILSLKIRQQDAAVTSAQRYLAIATDRIRLAIGPYLDVFGAQTTLLSNQQTAVNLRMQQLTDSDQLIEALGGGSDASQMPSPQDIAAKSP